MAASTPANLFPASHSWPVARVSLGFRVAAMLLAASWTSDAAHTVAAAEADAVLTRYVAGLEHTSHPADCPAVAVEIEASLSGHPRGGRLLAVRYSPPGGVPSYQVLQVEGDRTIRQQVIARYLSAQVQAGHLSPSSVEITPANYRFRYAGSIETAGTLTYIFEITPRKKRAGLMKGQLWIDAATGKAVRQAGRLVKTPSIFLRRIDVRRDTTIRDGAPDLRVTHLEIETRLVGHAELTIKERACTPQSAWAIARSLP